MVRTQRNTRKSTLASSRRVAPPALMIEGSSAMARSPVVEEEQYRDVHEVPTPQEQQIEEVEKRSDSDLKPSEEEEEQEEEQNQEQQ